MRGRDFPILYRSGSYAGLMGLRGHLARPLLSFGLLSGLLYGHLTYVDGLAEVPWRWGSFETMSLASVVVVEESSHSKVPKLNWTVVVTNSRRTTVVVLALVMIVSSYLQRPFAAKTPVMNSPLPCQAVAM